jgi:hypothetical protein
VSSGAIVSAMTRFEDTDSEVPESYGVIVDREVGGQGSKRKARCFRRASIIIDWQGVLRNAYKGVAPHRRPWVIRNHIKGIDKACR